MMSRYIGILVVIVSFILLFAMTAPGWSHSWYHHSCCSDQDCAEVIEREETGHGDLIVTSKHGTVLIPQTMERKPSQDGKEHVCMGSYSGNLGGVENRMYPICYYVPGGS